MRASTSNQSSPARRPAAGWGWVIFTRGTPQTALDLLPLWIVFARGDYRKSNVVPPVPTWVVIQQGTCPASIFSNSSSATIFRLVLG